MSKIRRLIRWMFWLGLMGVLGVALAIGGAYYVLAPKLPDVRQIREIPLQVPLKVYSRDGKLIAIIGESRRTPVTIDEVPMLVRHAVISIEDARFYEHRGIDLMGIGRAVWLMATTDDKRVPGGSTITQQLAKNYFLSNEYSMTRKISEMFLAIKLERELTKDEILELYLNKIFFGYRSYGIAAAAEFYYGKTLDQLTAPEAAMLASIPKFPSSGNPLTNPDRAMLRRNYVLTRMAELGYLTEAESKAAIAEPDHAHPHEPPIELDAPYLAEMARVVAIEQLGNDALIGGYKLYTTLESTNQESANRAVRDQLVAFDRRHGYRGPEAKLTTDDLANDESRRAAMSGMITIQGLIPGVVTEVDPDQALVWLQDGQQISLDATAVKWARPFLNESAVGKAPAKVSDALAVGDVIRVSLDPEGKWRFEQLPKAQAALVGLDSENGAVRALVGGFSFSRSKFNRANQSTRQPGSSFKPFVYSAAFDKGFTPASIVNDAPLSFADPSSPDGVWRPQNDNEKFNGPMRLREAMVSSRNLVSVRVLDGIGIRYARDYVQRFGFPPEALPENLSMALGTASLSPLHMARGYAVFANGGYLVEPYFVERITDAAGKTVFEATPALACRACPERADADGRPAGNAAADLSAMLGGAPVADVVVTADDTTPADTTTAVAPGGLRLAPRVLDARTAFLVRSVLNDVVKRGTGRSAMVLERGDLSGKTGTTNEHRDAWFSGFTDGAVATVWMGYDDFKTLGEGEFAAQTALPIWIEYMRTALSGVAVDPMSPPEGITPAMVSPASGQLMAQGAGGVLEYFKNEDLLRLSEAGLQQDPDGHAEQQTLEIF